MVSPIGREVDRGGGCPAARQNHRAWDCNELLLHKRVSERHVRGARNGNLRELIGMARSMERERHRTQPDSGLS